jgi:aminopeptidase N
VAVDTAEGTVHHRLAVERASHDLMLQLESEPVLVRIDPNFRVLCELDFDRPVGEMLTALRQDPVVTGRIFAARDLAEKAPREPAAKGLAEALDRDPFYGVRIEAAKALGRVRGPAARSALDRALADPDARVRTAAAEALGEFRDDSEAAKALQRVVASEQAYGTYAAAVLSLARIGAPEARETALRALGVDSHRERIRAAALGALAEIGDQDALKTVREWTAYGKPPRARTAAIAALAELAAGEGPQRERTIRDLLALLDDPYIFARQEAMQGLAALRAEEALDALERSAKVETDSRLRREARRAIQEISEPRSSGKTIEELAAEIERLRREVRSQSDRLGVVEKQGP